jgi:hypothetical protein
MTSHMCRSIALLAGAFLYGMAAHGDTIYNETVLGDLSNSGLTPTLLTRFAGIQRPFRNHRQKRHYWYYRSRLLHVHHPSRSVPDGHYRPARHANAWGPRRLVHRY